VPGTVGLEGYADMASGRAPLGRVIEDVHHGSFQQSRLGPHLSRLERDIENAGTGSTMGPLDGALDDLVERDRLGFYVGALVFSCHVDQVPDERR